MDMNNLPSSPQSTLNFSHKPQDLALTRRITRETFSLQSTNLAPDLTTYHRRHQQVLIVISCLTLTFTGCDFNFAFGVYQEHYETLGGPFRDPGPGEIDLIGTLAASLMTIGAPFASAWAKTYRSHPVTTLGGARFAAACIPTPFGTQLWHFQLTQGLL